MVLTAVMAGWAGLLGTPDGATAATAVTERCSDNHAIKVPQWPKWIRHKVMPRESIDQIAYRYNVAPWQLRGWNGLRAELERVKRGTRLRVRAARIPPPRVPMDYTIVQGDTWPKVAAKHGVNSWDLRSYNWPYRKKMRPGNTLRVFADPILYDWIHGSEREAAIRPGAAGVGAPDSGELLNGVRIPDGDGYSLRYPGTSYGTTYAVRQVVRAFEAFHASTGYTGTVRLGSMSGPKGGPLGHHKSHQTGRDLDIRLPRRAGVPKYLELKARRVDWRATWDLVKAIARTQPVVVFLDYKRQKYLHKAAKAAGATPEELRLIQYPRGTWSGRGMVRHYPGHDRHLHARWGCGPCETECVNLVKQNPAAP